MNFITALLMQREKYPTIITDEVVDFCKNIFGGNEFHFVVEDTKTTELGENLVIQSKTNVGSISLAIHPNAKDGERPISLHFQDLHRGVMSFDICNFNGQKKIDGFSIISTENGEYRMWTQGYGSEYLGYTFCTNENAKLLRQVYGDDWRYRMLTQEEIPYERKDFEIENSTQNIVDMIKKFYLYDDVMINRLKADKARNGR